MVRSIKWLEGTKPQQPISEVARRALRARLETVWHYATLAARTWEESIEFVHQLRVATRRARAALRIFAGLLPKQRETRWMKKGLRKLRHAAGDARDLDVIAERLRKIVELNTGSHLGAMFEQIAAGRRKAQRPLVSVYERAKRKGFEKRSRALAEAARWQREEPESTFADASRTTLAPLVDEFFGAAAADLSDVQTLHQMRIAGKQLRYAMELLAGAFEESFRGQLYATFEEVQEKLGTINDHATAIAMFNEWCERADYSGSRAELAELIANEEKQLEAKCQQFRDWWTGERAEEFARRFAQMLRTPTLPTEDEASVLEPSSEEIREVETVTSGRQEAAAYA